MGVYVQLKVLDQHIPDDEWAALFDETLCLLKAQDAIGPKREKISFENKSELERIYFSRNIENDADHPENYHWHVTGDIRSLLTGESFILHQKLRPKEDYRPAGDDVDILRELVKEVESDRGGEYDSVFNSKTQGHPYHYDMLAAAMLIEDRFPRYAVVSGDIDRFQAERARKIIRKVLKKEVALPVVTEWGRLMDRIMKFRSGLEAIEAYSLIVRDDLRRDGKERFRAIMERFDESLFHQWIMKELKEYKMPRQNGCLDIFADWLNAGLDLKTLAELACIREEGPRFAPDKFADALIDALWLTVEMEKRKQFDIFQKRKGDVDGVMSQFGKVMFEMMGVKGRDLHIYMPEEQLLEILEDLFPDSIELLRNRAAEAKEKAMEELESSREYFERLGSDDPAVHERNSLLDGTEFFEMEEDDPLSDSQTFFLTGIAASLNALAEYLCTQETGAKELITTADRDSKLFFLTNITSDRGPHLTEDAWGWIDREADEELLKTLCLLALIDKHYKTFWNVRKSIFEKRWLCRRVTDWSKDEEKVADFRRKISEESDPDSCD